MGELGSIWLYQEDDADDLKRKLQTTLMELEQVKLQVSAAMEKERQYHTLLQIACRERDEAREQLYNLIIRSTTPPPPPPLRRSDNNNHDSLVNVFDESNGFLKQQQLQLPRANSSITESNTLSDSLFNNSYISSSPVDSIFDAETSPEFSTLNHTGGESGDKNNNDGVLNNHQTLVNNRYDDHATVMIDELVKGKVLPRKGKLLEAVMEAGPLLKTLMLAGPLPSWRNPPTLQQPFKIPPFTEMSCSSMLNFSNGDVRRVSPAMNMNNNQIVVGKRQRLM